MFVYREYMEEHEKKCITDGNCSGLSFRIMGSNVWLKRKVCSKCGGLYLRNFFPYEQLRKAEELFGAHEVGEEINERV